ncbi:hypothetical protein COLO4_05472 [Corchorus olitorius]|uniref:Uncharacterized protein n=1 Tax=Corchorus olitorius TaxID=93759 RepID=A0A1R3KQR2_9ROSI|nr:hypothetical protein COLO4_05472 [Corchorus olitorius]
MIDSGEALLPFFLPLCLGPPLLLERIINMEERVFLIWLWVHGAQLRYDGEETAVPEELPILPKEDPDRKNQEILGQG